ncbi:major facilitator superfamily transporter [Colletotrichum graminicola]|uniref:Major facilitator superfamily transporter n=1 Tax=Colletotrichum graminicola (strain M1.001 / M2 / FGSC 10212) TaxID=645133 RepID=E3QMD3_COLGM|nr:major facilitator superfamily transporter [Colletotrichum graminicola M1.001]EFQ32021.1 major facilitator superfamily transporter [Colletotrichum graminicola M1.001]WDK17098.1 major facilitator superfamily transporter [Colletotrichum graminicola]
MGWGVVETPGQPFAPGTVLLEDKKIPDEITVGDDGLKRKQGVILQPQPGDDPNDPLMWSTAWKFAHLFVIVFGSSAANAITTMVVPGIAPLVDKFGATQGSISSLILNAPTFFTSLAAFFVVSGAEIFGRRPFYVISTAVMAAANLGSFLATTYSVLVVSRAIAGIFSAATFTLVTATIADIFYVHQRGSAVASWNVGLTVGGQLGQIIGGVVTDKLGISAVFGLAAVVFAALFFPTYFLVLESAYFKRGDDIGSRQQEKKSKDSVEVEYAKNLPARKVPYLKQLGLFRGKMTDKTFWMGSLKPLFFLSSPIILYSALLNSLVLVLSAGVTNLIVIILSDAPYNLQPTDIGLTGLPILVVSLIGGPLIGWLSDWSVRFMARSNGSNPGVAEPEFRLVLLIIALPMTAAGLVGLGIAIQQGQPLLWLLTWLSLISFGSCIGVQVSVGYMIDYLPSHSAQAFTIVNMIASLVVFAGTTPLIDWLQASGPVVVFSSLAGVTMANLIFSFPLYVYGKRIRTWYGSTRLSRWVLN